LKNVIRISLFLVIFGVLQPIVWADVVPTPIPKSVKSFPDLASHHAKNAIERFATVFEVSGKEGTPYFSPESPVRRAEAAYLMAKLFQLSTAVTTSSKASDLNTAPWAAPYIAAVLKNDKMSLLGDTQFFPDALISRFDGIVLALNGVSVSASPSRNAVFEDVPDNLNNKLLIDYGLDAGIIPPSWIKAKKLRPNSPITRGELMYMLSQTTQAKTLIARYFGDISLPEKTATPTVEIPTYGRVLGFKIDPEQLTATSRLPIMLSASISPGSVRIKRVKANLSPLNNVEELWLNDNGQWHDKAASDSIYSGLFQLGPNVSPGMKEIPMKIDYEDGHSVIEKVSLLVSKDI